MEKKDERKEQGLVTRRQLLKCGAAAGAGLLVSKKLGAFKAYAQSPETCPLPGAPPWVKLTPFVDRLPSIPYLGPTKPTSGTLQYNVTIDNTMHQWHKELQSAPAWGFNGIFPGPVINGWRDNTVQVTFTNNLQNFVVCPDMRIHGASPIPYATVHFHGLLDRPEDDGFPEDRFPPGTSYTYEFPNIQEGATYWYHDHALGVTRTNIYSGLAGFYLLRDQCEWQLKLPRGMYEVPLVIQDKEFLEDGSLWFPFPWAPEFFGKYTSVNGKVWPVKPVRRGLYRFRILNGCTSRFYRLWLHKKGSTQSLPFTVIGTDGGLLPQPVSVDSGLIIAPAERIDMVLDFSQFQPGDELIVTNDAPAPFPGGTSPVDTYGDEIYGYVMKFKVGSATGWSVPLPQSLCPLPSIGNPVYTRNVALYENAYPCDPTLPQPRLNNLLWDYPNTETPKAGSVEVWNIIDTTEDSHPIHIHQTQFRILQRRPFDVTAYLNLWKPFPSVPDVGMCTEIPYPGQGPYPVPEVPESMYLGDPELPAPYENGMKDTVRANPGYVTTILIPFGPFKGRFVWHCHMLDHEDNEMMRPLMLL